MLTKSMEEVKSHPWFSGINWESVYSGKYKPPFVPVLKGEHDTTYFSAALTTSSLESVSCYAAPVKENENNEGKYFSGFDYNPDE